MNIKIIKINKENGGFSIWIDSDQNFSLSRLLEDLSILDLDMGETIYQSFGPAEIIEKYSTKAGAFFISREFDEFAGTMIYSDNLELMDQICKLMLSSGNYVL
jgi:hypothetical protein